MPDTLSLTMSLGTSPQAGAPSGYASVVTPVDDTYSLTNKILQDVTLSADPAQAVAFGSLTAAGVIKLRATGGPVTAIITWSGGTSQAIPVDPEFTLVTRTNQITGLSLQRSPGTLTTVEVFLGQIS